MSMISKFMRKLGSSLGFVPCIDYIEKTGEVFRWFSFIIRELDFHLMEFESICLILFTFTPNFLKDKRAQGF